jgi:hypothetical protein
MGNSASWPIPFLFLPMKNQKLRKVVKIQDGIIFDDGTVLTSFHEQDCCEVHILDFADLDLREFEGLEFNLDPSNDGKAFFKRIPEYGIELIPIHGHSIKIPGYGYNNGYYSQDLKLEIKIPYQEPIYFDITDCQKDKYQ